MEIQFEKSAFSCLKWNVHSVHYQEVTQDIRVSDDMPDVGSILGAWGQVLLRGKEWNSDIGVSGGVMVWVLYLPEGGSEPHCLESWLPFQEQWDLPEGDMNGKILCKCYLRSIDARSVSARKIIVRGCIGILCDAVKPHEIELYAPVGLPEDVQVLRKTYPITLPTEAGEKAFTLDESLSIPVNSPKLEKILCYELYPQMIDQKILAGKAVFRGMCVLHLLYTAEDGQIYNRDFDIPFSQYTDLEREYGENAEISVFCESTNLELDVDDEGLVRLRAGLTGQYMVYDQVLAEIVSDAYSPVRTVTSEQKRLEIPALLEYKQSAVTVEQSVATDLDKVVDITCLTDFPEIRRNGAGFEAVLPVSFAVLYYGKDGNLQSISVKAEREWDIPADPDCQLHMMGLPSGKPQISLSENGITLRMDSRIQTSAFAGKGMDTVSGMTLGEAKELDPARPSLILRRAGKNTIWEIAKLSGSTVDAIMKANHLDTEPEPEAMLLIPVL